MFATDRDLLAIEPGVFAELAWTGQTLVSGTAIITGTTLTAVTQDVGFDAARVAAGHVVTLSGVGFEVVAPVSGSVLTVSKLRPSAADDPLPASVTTGQAMSVATFGPQISIVHGQVLRMLGVSAAVGDELVDGQGRVTEAAIVNVAELARLEALGALHLAYSSASGAMGPDSLAWARAEHYRELYEEERGRAAARLDADGDGLIDATRRPGVAALVRG